MGILLLIYFKNFIKYCHVWLLWSFPLFLCTAETHLKVLIAAGRRNHHRHLYRSPIHGHVSVSHLQRIPWVPVFAVSLYHSLLHIAVCYEYTALEGFIYWSKCENGMVGSPGCMQGVSASNCMTFSWFWTLTNLTGSIILLHDCVCLYVIHRLQDQLNAMQREGLKHPDLLPCDFHIFGPFIFQDLAVT